jgi:hypothetical protein
MDQFRTHGSQFPTPRRQFYCLLGIIKLRQFTEVLA